MYSLKFDYDGFCGTLYLIVSLFESIMSRTVKCLYTSSASLMLMFFMYYFMLIEILYWYLLLSLQRITKTDKHLSVLDHSLAMMDSGNKFWLIMAKYIWQITIYKLVIAQVYKCFPFGHIRLSRILFSCLLINYSNLGVVNLCPLWNDLEVSYYDSNIFFQYTNSSIPLKIHTYN